MKIYIIHIDLLQDIDKQFRELTDQEVIDLCSKDEEREHHDVYETAEELSAYWNTEEVFYPTSSYMRVIKDEPEHVWVFTAEQAWDGEFADTIVHVFPTEDAAVKYMHDFLLDDGGDKSIREYVKRKEWEVEIDEPTLYRASRPGYYAHDHIELTISKCVIENK